MRAVGWFAAVADGGAKRGSDRSWGNGVLPVTDFVDLNRRFRDLRDAELVNSEFDDPGILASLDEWGLGSSFGWGRVLEHPRVVLLAEAGAGKSREMSEQVKCLVEDGRYAFFAPLESLDRDPLTTLLEPPQEVKFEAWLTDGKEPGWFFLDAVDELKLTNGKLDRALLRLSRDIAGHLHRAHIIVSCRPSDWRPSLDLITVQNRLPVPEQAGEIIAPEPEEVFMAAFRPASAEPVHFGHRHPSDPASSAVWTVAMLPMNDSQIMEFAKHRGVKNAGAFLEEMERENAWDFARRPLDLADLVENWGKSGRLGTRAEQHETNATAKLRDDPDRPDRDEVSDREARAGAESLALGLALTRTRTIGSPERTVDGSPGEGVLHADAILPGWTEGRRQSLLRRALFDPATYGRIRFHHRSVQEYLAACKLRGLRDKGMSRAALFRLLFAEVYGVDVVRPSMRAIAAWLALRDSDVRGELIKRKPEVLLSFGDPSALELESRARLLRAFVAEYGHGGWRGLDIPMEAVRRLSHPELADVIRECWEDGASNVDVRHLLIEMIWQGRIARCADLAHDAAFDAECDHHCRITAVKALLACDLDETVRECASAMLTDAASWPDEVVCHVATYLFPRIISAEEIATLMETRHEEADTSWGFNWISKHIAKTVEPKSSPAILLREKIADLILRTREDQLEPYRARSKFSYLAPALAVLCERQLPDLAGEPMPGLIDACVIASRFGAGETDPDNSVGKLRKRFDTGMSMRSQAVWAEQAFMDELAPTGDDSKRFYRTAHDNLVGSLTEADRPWLETGVADGSRPARRPVALHVLIGLWFRRGRICSELDELREFVKDDAGLLRTLSAQTTPPPKDDERQRKIAEAEREHQCWKKDHAAREEKRLEEWRKWREWLVDNLDEAFSADKVSGTLSTVHLWLREYKQDHNHYNNWDREALEQAFGPEVAERAEEAFRAFWRKKQPMLWSTRPVGERNSTPQGWIKGLIGVSAEASHSGWARNLTPPDASAAAAYTTIELNGFAPFIIDLAEAHPSQVEAIIGGEVSAELAVGNECEHLPTLQNLGHADSKLKRLLVPRLLAELRSWPDVFPAENAPKWLHHLERMFRVLTEAERNEDREAISRNCLKRYEADPGGPLAIMWLRGLFQFDPQCGTKTLIGTLGDGSDARASARAVETFAALFGGFDPVVPEVPDPTECARVFGELVRSAYAFVRREDDLVHKGAYSPDTRDDAQTARNFLLSRLLETPGPEAHRVVLELSCEEDFQHFPDRLRLLAREKAATEGELRPFDPADIVALEDNLEAPARDAEGLFSVMMDRLGDLAHYLRHHDLSDRNTVQGITEESEMRRTLAMRLEARANGAYKVAQEEEVADRKRTDIRMLAVKGNHKTVIEIKIADKGWTLKQLVKALQDQLVGQYLRHSDCKSGCLLLTHGGKRKGWRHPDSGKWLSPPEAVEFLRERAARIETETSRQVRLAVFWLDLTDPLPKPNSCGDKAGSATGEMVLESKVDATSVDGN